MTINDPIHLDKAKELDNIKANTKAAQNLLNLAEYNAGELSNRNLLEYKQARVISTYFDRAMDPLRELIEYLEGLDHDITPGNTEKG